MVRNPNLSRRSFLLVALCLFGLMMFVSISCNLPTKTPVAAPQEPPADAPMVLPSVAPVVAPEDAPMATGEIKTGQEAPAATVARDFYGPACDSGEEEGAPFRWSVELLQDPATGKLEGTIKFHACPGGGRAVYRVSGAAGNETVFTLTGKKVSGGGELFGAAPEQETFTFDTSSGALSPNLAP
jgi:hypothetical protein